MSRKNDFNKAARMFRGMMPMMPTMPMMPMMPMMPFMQNMNSCGAFDNSGCEDFKSGAKRFWEQMNDAQKAALDGTKDQWNQFFEHSMEMLDTFADYLPDEAPSLPGLPFTLGISPKSFVKRVKEFQEMANAHAVEQADSVADFCIKGREKAADLASAVIENVKPKEEEKAEPAPAQAEPAQAEPTEANNEQ